MEIHRSHKPIEGSTHRFYNNVKIPWRPEQSDLRLMRSPEDKGTDLAYNQYTP